MWFGGPGVACPLHVRYMSATCLTCGLAVDTVKLLENVVAIQVEVLTKNYPLQLASQHALAVAYQVKGQVKKAVELLEYVVAI
jgi:hypothetical protein